MYQSYNFIVVNFSVSEGTRVHFEVSFEPIFTAVSTPDVAAVLERELETPFFLNIGVLAETLHIEVSKNISEIF